MKPPRPDLLAAVERDFSKFDAPANWSDRAIGRLVADLGLRTSPPREHIPPQEDELGSWVSAYNRLYEENGKLALRCAEAERRVRVLRGYFAGLAFVCAAMFVACVTLLGVLRG